MLIRKRGLGADRFAPISRLEAHSTIENAFVVVEYILARDSQGTGVSLEAEYQRSRGLNAST
jgi:hypothetical protein